MSRQTTHQGPASPLRSIQGSAVSQLSGLGAATPELFSQSTATPNLLNPSATHPHMSNQSEATPQLFDQGAATPCLFSQSTAVPHECNPSATTPQLFDQGAATPGLFNQGPAKHQMCFEDTDTPLTSSQLPGAQTSTWPSGYATWSTRGGEDGKKGVFYSPEQAYLNFIVPDADDKEDGSRITFDKDTEDKRDEDDDDFVYNNLSVNREGGDDLLSDDSNDDESDDSSANDSSSDDSSDYDSSSAESSDDDNDDNGITAEDMLSSDDEEDKVAKPDWYPLPLRYRKQCPVCGRIPTRAVRRQRYEALKTYRDFSLSGLNLSQAELSRIRRTPVKYQFFSACQHAVGSLLCWACKFPRPTSPLCAPDPPSPFSTQPSAKSGSKRNAKSRRPLQRQVKPRETFSPERITVLVRAYKKAKKACLMSMFMGNSGDQPRPGSCGNEQATDAQKSSSVASDVTSLRHSSSVACDVTSPPQSSSVASDVTSPPQSSSVASDVTSPPQSTSVASSVTVAQQSDCAGNGFIAHVQQSCISSTSYLSEDLVPSPEQFGFDDIIVRLHGYWKAIAVSNNVTPDPLPEQSGVWGSEIIARLQQSFISPTSYLAENTVSIPEQYDFEGGDIIARLQRSFPWKAIAVSSKATPDPLPEQSDVLESDVIALQETGSVGCAITGIPEQSSSVGVNQASEPQPVCSDQQEQGSRGRSLQRRVPFSRRQLQRFDLSENYCSPERPTGTRRSYQRQRPVSRVPRNDDDSRSTQ